LGRQEKRTAWEPAEKIYCRRRHSPLDHDIGDLQPLAPGVIPAGDHMLNDKRRADEQFRPYQDRATSP
jgi:hypothetical protein